jgi:hypothetical protein
MWRFLQHVNATYNLDLNDYPGLYKWSVEYIADFWNECWQFVGIKASQPFSEVGLLLIPLSYLTVPENMSLSIRKSYVKFYPFYVKCPASSIP